MRVLNKAFAFSTGIILLSNLAFAQPITLTDINYNFDQTKVDASEDSFHFLRSFADYYFKIIAKNTHSLNIAKKAGAISGWCVGDAHAENFGILIQEDDSNIFTMNDMDDSGPCPVAYDLLRMLVSTKLYMPNINANEIIKSYTAGLSGKNVKLPNAIKSMDNDATKKGKQISAKKIQGNVFKRKNSMEEVGSDLKVKITSLLQTQYKAENLRVLDMIATSKIGGGSSGLQRYEILISNSQNQLIHLELKELVAPSITSVATTAIPNQASRIKKTLKIILGEMSSHYYNVFKIQEKDMLLRPKFSGNQGIKLSDSSDKDNVEIINFEAYILGVIHSNTVNVSDYSRALDKMDSSDWEDDIKAFTILFNNKFNELK